MSETTDERLMRNEMELIRQEERLKGQEKLINQINNSNEKTIDIIQENNKENLKDVKDYAKEENATTKAAIKELSVRYHDNNNKNHVAIANNASDIKQVKHDLESLGVIVRKDMDEISKEMRGLSDGFSDVRKDISGLKKVFNEKNFTVKGMIYILGPIMVIVGYIINAIIRNIMS